MSSIIIKQCCFPQWQISSHKSPTVTGSSYFHPQSCNLTKRCIPWNHTSFHYVYTCIKFID